MDTRPIGIMDSGSGGVSILKSLQQELPAERFIYIGDHAFVPYSQKTVFFIRKRVIRIIKTLVSMQVKCVVVACNTATVVGIHEYRKRFPTIPIIGVVPVIKTAVEQTKTKNIAVISTPVTAKSRYEHDLIKDFATGIRVMTLGNSRIVACIESGTFESGRIIRKEIEAMKKKLKSKDIDVIALGCTHFPLVRKEFEDIFGSDISIIDSGAAVARQVRQICVQNGVLADKKRGDDQFFTTGDPLRISKLFSSLFNRAIVVRSIAIA